MVLANTTAGLIQRLQKNANKHTLPPNNPAIWAPRSEAPTSQTQAQTHHTYTKYTTYTHKNLIHTDIETYTHTEINSNNTPHLNNPSHPIVKFFDFRLHVSLDSSLLKTGQIIKIFLKQCVNFWLAKIFQRNSLPE